MKQSRMLKTWAEYTRILSHGGRVEDRDFTLFFYRKSGKWPRLGILVSKRLGKAVKRNRCRRLLKESYRLNQELFGSAIDIIIKAKRDISQLAFKEIEANLIKLGKAIIEDTPGRI